MKGRVIVVIVGVVASAVLLAVLSPLGVPQVFAASWILLAVAVIIVVRLVSGSDAVEWPPPKPEVARRGSDVSRLAWSINPRTGAAGRAIVSRVTRIRDRRLALRGLDAADTTDHEAIDRLLGEGVRESLEQHDVSRADLERAMDALERLSPHFPDPVQNLEERNDRHR